MMIPKKKLPPPTRGKKKKIRAMRPIARKNEDGTTSTHVMAWVGDETKRRGNFGVYPTITPKKGKTKSSDPKDWMVQSARQAEDKGEMINVRRRKKAEKLAAGSWKKGVDKKDAMKEYRSFKRSSRRSF